MNIGFIGLGKLGLPCALAIESRGHQVLGCDPDPNVAYSLGCKQMLHQEQGAQPLLERSRIELVTMEQLAARSDIIFVAVQTPHQPQYEGVTRLPDTRADFDYRALRTALLQLRHAATGPCRVVIISTVLPGTTRRELLPLCGDQLQLCYNPFFIAMGTTIRDFLQPEFVLMGGADTSWLQQFYSSLHDRPHYVTDIDSAELIKVAYNTFIGMKIVFANTLMELCHHTGADVDQVTGAMGLATDRLLSPRYLRGGMGDGGACHVRDGIAMSWLARKHQLSHNFFDDLMLAREHQTEFLAELIAQEAAGGLPVLLLGRAFKPDTEICTGSAALLLSRMLTERGIVHQHPDRLPAPPTIPAVYFIATAHPEFRQLRFPPRSVVLDPWAIIADQPGVRVRRIGRK